jgi:hypothetical protein
MNGMDCIGEGAQVHPHPNLFEGSCDIAHRVRTLDRT